MMTVRQSRVAPPSLRSARCKRCMRAKYKGCALLPNPFSLYSTLAMPRMHERPARILCTLLFCSIGLVGALPVLQKSNVVERQQARNMGRPSTLVDLPDTKMYVVKIFDHQEQDCDADWRGCILPVTSLVEPHRELNAPVANHVNIIHCAPGGKPTTRSTRSYNHCTSGASETRKPFHLPYTSPERLLIPRDKPLWAVWPTSSAARLVISVQDVSLWSSISRTTGKTTTVKF